MMVMYRRALVTAGLFALFTLWAGAPFLFAEDERQNRASLSGIKALYVFVEKVDAEVEKDGLTQDQIRREIEARLQKAGIRTIPKAEAFDVSGSPYLYVNANILKLKATREYIYSITAAFKQDVYLAREPVMVLGAATWSTGQTIGITGSVQKIRASIAAQVEQFVGALLDVNPR